MLLKWIPHLGLIILPFSIIVTALSLWAEISSIWNGAQMSTDQLVYSIIIWTLGTTAFLLNNLVIYLILRKSTTEIKEYKLYLLNFTVSFKDMLFNLGFPVGRLLLLYFVKLDA
jgi:hypothetical protein